jgi:hypothetical protein
MKRFAFSFSLIVLLGASTYLGLKGNNLNTSSSDLDKIYRKYSNSKIVPASDTAILRRLSLQLRGTIPDGGETLDWKQKSTATKLRDTSIQYLRSPEFAEYWGTKFGSLFREQTNRRKEVYGGFYRYLAESIHEDKPYDQLVREMLTSSGDLSKNPAAHFYARDGADPLQVGEYVGRVFYAQRVGCARCHDDKFDPSFTQRDYYALSAFFSQQFYENGRWDEKRFPDSTLPYVPNSDIERLPIKMQKPVRDRNNDWNRNFWNKMSQKQREDYNKSIELEYGKLYYVPDLGLRFPVTDTMPGGDLLIPKLLDGTVPKIQEGADRRKVFADWLLDKNNPRFRKVIINRIWKDLMGWAFFTPEDDWNKNTKMQGEDILNHLDQVFLEKNHSIKELVFYIVNSEAFIRRNPSNEKESKDSITFYPSKRMDPDQLLNSIVKGALEVEQPKWLLSQRSMSILDFSKLDLKGRGKISFPDREKKDASKAAEMERPPRPDQFLAVFGAGGRTDVADDHTEITIDQILTLMNGRLVGKASWEFGGKNSQSQETFEKTKSMQAVVNESFLILLGRELNNREKELLRTSLSRGDSFFDRAILQDWVWAILNSQEFLHVN